MNESNALATSDNGHVFSGIQAFDAAQRMAKALSSSALVPKIYQGQQGLANSLIALELAGRMGISPLTVMQNMTPINGRPSWSSSFLIGTVNACGRFSPLRFIFDDDDNPTSCYAEANDLASGEVLRGEKITIAMAKAEGWYGRQGSKWQTFPGQMLRYRAGAFWARVYCPEISLGIVTKEEAIDVETVEVSVAEPVAPTVDPLTKHVVDTAIEALEAADVAMVQSETLTAALAAIDAAPDGAPMSKFLERANQLLSEGKINDQEYAAIDAAAQGRSKPEPAPNGAGHEGSVRPVEQGDATKNGDAAENGPAMPRLADEDATADAGEPPTPPAQHDPGVDPLPPAGDSPPEPDPSPELKLRDRQQLIRSINSCTPERRSALRIALIKHFSFPDDETPIANQLRTEAHAQFVNTFLKST
jgi:hypothetical protein